MGRDKVVAHGTQESALSILWTEAKKVIAYLPAFPCGSFPRWTVLPGCGWRFAAMHNKKCGIVTVCQVTIVQMYWNGAMPLIRSRPGKQSECGRVKGALAPSQRRQDGATAEADTPPGQGSAPPPRRGRADARQCVRSVQSPPSCSDPTIKQEGPATRTSPLPVFSRPGEPSR